MRNVEKRSLIARFSVLTGLWAINLLIVIFGFPFLIYKKVRDIFIKPVRIAPTEKEPSSKSSQYFPCSSKL
jgi:hypothetical protein